MKLLFACALAVTVAACFGTHVSTNVGGNRVETCSGDECECEGTGNCSFSCPDGGCAFDCDNTGNCFATCKDDCTIACRGTGNCSLQCEGSNCSVTTCTIEGNCVCQDADGVCAAN